MFQFYERACQEKNSPTASAWKTFGQICLFSVGVASQSPGTPQLFFLHAGRGRCGSLGHLGSFSLSSFRWACSLKIGRFVGRLL
jgi:hypothetical protein